MTTASKVIERAFSRAGIKTAEVPLEATEIQDGLDLLNDLGSMWEQSLKIGFQPVELITDIVRMPRFAEMAFKEGLAVRLRIEYRRAPDPVLIASADDAFTQLSAALIDIGDVAYPGTLPIGSGNECPNLTDRRFFDQNKVDNF